MKKEYIIKIAVLVLVLSFILVAIKIDLFKVEAVAKSDEPKVVMMAKDSPATDCTVYVYRYYTSTGFYDFAVVNRHYHGGVAITQLR